MVTTRRFAAIQTDLVGRVSLTDPPGLKGITFIAGGDACYDSVRCTPTHGAACFAVCRYPSMELVETVLVEGTVRVPYIPSFLAFRELPLFLKAYRRISRRVDVFLIDAQGIAHPRGLGFASHFGVVTGEVSIGCAKSRLIGEFADQGDRPGAASPLYAGTRRIGSVLRPLEGRHVLFVSPGHRISVASSLRIVRGCLRGRRMPEPIQIAHSLLAEARSGGRAASRTGAGSRAPSSR